MEAGPLSHATVTRGLKLGTFQFFSSVTHPSTSATGTHLQSSFLETISPMPQCSGPAPPASPPWPPDPTGAVLTSRGSRFQGSNLHRQPWAWLCPHLNTLFPYSSFSKFEVLTRLPRPASLGPNPCLPPTIAEILLSGLQAHMALPAQTSAWGCPRTLKEVKLLPAYREHAKGSQLEALLERQPRKQVTPSTEKGAREALGEGILLRSGTGRKYLRGLVGGSRRGIHLRGGSLGKAPVVLGATIWDQCM